MVSIVIAAHNEATVIGATLDALLAQRTLEPLEIVVSANACTDDTVAVATKRNVTVIDRPHAGKAAALNAGDHVARTFPRIYLDADIVVPEGSIQRLLDRFDAHPTPLAVVPGRRIDTRGRPWMVRGYFAINERLPVFRDGLFGRGTVVLSEPARRRFDEFPNQIADDLFLDSQFADAEKAEVDDVKVLIAAPYTTRDLLRRLIRVRRGNAQLRAAAARSEVSVTIRPSDRWSWLRDVLLPNPRLAFAAGAYLSLTIAAEILSRRRPRSGNEWGRDNSTRKVHPEGPNG